MVFIAKITTKAFCSALVCLNDFCVRHKGGNHNQTKCGKGEQRAGFCVSFSRSFTAEEVQKVIWTGRQPSKVCNKAFQLKYATEGGRGKIYNKHFVEPLSKMKLVSNEMANKQERKGEGGRHIDIFRKILLCCKRKKSQFILWRAFQKAEHRQRLWILLADMLIWIAWISCLFFFFCSLQRRLHKGSALKSMGKQPSKAALKSFGFNVETQSESFYQRPEPSFPILSFRASSFVISLNLITQHQEQSIYMKVMKYEAEEASGREIKM